MSFGYLAHRYGKEYVQSYAIAAVLLLAFATLFVTWNEMRYLVWGQRVEARVEKLSVVTTRSRRFGTESQRLEVKYRFFDPELKADRVESDSMGTSWVPNAPETEDGPVTATVQYLPGVADRSRIDGHVQWWAPVLFVGSLVAGAVAVWVFMRGYYDHQRRVAASAERPSTVGRSGSGRR